MFGLGSRTQYWFYEAKMKYKISLSLLLHFMYFSCCLLFYRLFGGKPSKQVPITTAENMKNSVVISNPHATMNQQGNLDSPSGSAVLSSGGSSPLYGKNTDLNQSPLASSPSSAHSAPSNSLTWGTNASSSSAVSKDGLGYQSVSSLHTSCESIDISLSSAGGLSHNSSSGFIPASKDDSLAPFVRTSSVKTTLSERLVGFSLLSYVCVSSGNEVLAAGASAADSDQVMPLSRQGRQLQDWNIQISYSHKGAQLRAGGWVQDGFLFCCHSQCDNFFSLQILPKIYC